MTDTSQRYARIARLSTPVILMMTMVSVVGLIDTALVSPFGADAVSAVGISNYIFISIFTIMIGINAATQALVARVVGRGDFELSRNVLGSALSIAAVLGVLGFCLLKGLDSWLINSLAASPNVARIGIEYTDWRSFTLLVNPAMQCFMGYRMGRGESKILFPVAVVVQSLNVFFSYALIYGVWGFPEMGVSGSGLGTSMSMAIGLVIHLGLARPIFRGGEISRSLVAKKLLQVGAGASTADFLMTLGWTTGLAITGLMGSLAQAASTVAMQIMLFGVFIFFAIGSTAGTLAGWSLAKNDVEDARLWVRQCCVFAFALGAPLILLLTVYTEPLLKSFVKDPVLVESATPIIVLIAASLLFDTVGNVLRGAISTVGAPLLTLQATLLPMWIVFLPGGWFVGVHLGYGLLGFWAMYVIYRALSMAGLIWVWRRGQWVHSLSNRLAS
jgi:MATE family multidrug resistance protein